MKLSTEERFEKMKEIRDELLHFKESPIYEYRLKNKYFPVVGEGSHSAHIMFIGEAPGKNEAETTFLRGIGKNSR
jgi:uracil-DNA glycosylase